MTEESTNDPIIKKKRRFYKRKIFWIFLVILLLVIGVGFVYYQSTKNISNIEYTTEDVKRGVLTQTVSATGEVESARDIDLNFRTPGKLVYLGAKEGDQVKSGQVLAKINSATLSAQINQYQANVNVAKADLERVNAGSSVEDIQVSEEQFIKTQNDLSSLKTERDSQLQSLREKSLDAINNSAFLAYVSLDVVYNYLLNDNLTSGLQVNNAGLANSVEIEYFKIKDKLNKAQINIDTANSLKNNETIIDASDNLRSVLLDLNNWLNDAYDLGNAIILSTTYTQTIKDTIKTSIDTEQATNNTSLSGLQTSKSNLITSIDSYDKQIQSAENNVAIYQAQLNLKKAGARDFEIKSAEARVAQAQAQLNQALADLADYSIVAPIDGTITKVNFDLGEQTNSSLPVIKMLSTEKYEVKISIPESDIAKLKVGDKSYIELDAFGSDHIFAGAISFIDPAQTVIQDVTYYLTTVSFEDDSWNDRIKPGMTADVDITTGYEDDVLYIPQRAVKIKQAILGEVPEKFVEVLVGDKETEEKVVVVGLRGDDGLVEIVSGLEEGDKVVTFKKDGK